LTSSPGYFKYFLACNSDPAASEHLGGMSSRYELRKEVYLLRLLFFSHF
jgi:hypothetical protein